MAQPQRIKPVESADPIWARIRSEGEAVVRQEPHLASFIYASLLEHDTLTSAVVQRISDRLDHPVMTPLQQRVRDTIGEPHRPLHHLDGPTHVHRCPSGVLDRPEMGSAFEVSVHLRIDRLEADGLFDLHPHPHPVRKRGRHDAVEHGPGPQPVALEAKLLQPARPVAEPVEPLDGLPEQVGCQREVIRPDELDDRSHDSLSVSAPHREVAW